MIATYEDLIAQCTSAGIRGHYDLAEQACLDLYLAVEAETEAGTPNALTEGLAARQRMIEIMGMYFPPE